VHTIIGRGKIALVYSCEIPQCKYIVKVGGRCQLRLWLEVFCLSAFLFYMSVCLYVGVFCVTKSGGVEQMSWPAKFTGKVFSLFPAIAGYSRLTAQSQSWKHCWLCCFWCPGPDVSSNGHFCVYLMLPQTHWCHILHVKTMALYLCVTWWLVPVIVLFFKA